VNTSFTPQYIYPIGAVRQRLRWHAPSYLLVL
jgi:hypothetical protein